MKKCEVESTEVERGGSGVAPEAGNDIPEGETRLRIRVRCIDNDNAMYRCSVYLEKPTEALRPNDVVAALLSLAARADGPEWDDGAWNQQEGVAS